jgi:hypothetical protein
MPLIRLGEHLGPLGPARVCLADRHRVEREIGAERFLQEITTPDVLPGDSGFGATAIPTGQAKMMVKSNFLTELQRTPA